MAAFAMHVCEGKHSYGLLSLPLTPAELLQCPRVRACRNEKLGQSYSCSELNETKSFCYHLLRRSLYVTVLWGYISVGVCRVWRNLSPGRNLLLVMALFLLQKGEGNGKKRKMRKSQK